MIDLRKLATDLAVGASVAMAEADQKQTDDWEVERRHIALTAVELAYYRQLLAQPGARSTPEDVQYGVALRINLETLLDAFAAKILDHPGVRAAAQQELVAAGLAVDPAPPTGEL